MGEVQTGCDNDGARHSGLRQRSRWWTKPVLLRLLSHVRHRSAMFRPALRSSLLSGQVGVLKSSSIPVIPASELSSNQLEVRGAL